MRARETALVAAREAQAALRGRWFLVATGSFLVLSLALSWLGLAGSQRSGLAGFDRTTASLLNLALLFVPLFTLSLGSLGIAGELEDGSLATLLVQPLTRGEVYLGKLVGMLGAVWAAILAGFGATGVIVGVARGGGRVGAYLGLVGLMMLLGAATLGIGALLSVMMRTRVRGFGAAFAVWLLMVYLSDLGVIGLAIARRLGPGQVFALSLPNPVEQARVLGTLSLSGRLEVLGPVGLFGVDHLGVAGTVVLAASLLVLTAVGSSLTGFAIFRKAVVT